MNRLLTSGAIQSECGLGIGMGDGVCGLSFDAATGSLYRGFVISRFFSIHYTITGLKDIVRYTEDFVT